MLLLGGLPILFRHGQNPIDDSHGHKLGNVLLVGTWHDMVGVQLYAWNMIWHETDDLGWEQRQTGVARHLLLKVVLLGV